MALTYRELLGEIRGLAAAVRRDAEAHRRLAAVMADESQDTRRIAESISALHVDRATVSETSEVAKIMVGMSTAALAYAAATDEASRTAISAEQQTQSDHGGIQEAADRSPVEMADRDWYAHV